MVVEGARFKPVEADCARLALDYRPLDARFDASAVVLFGSNMGGKTVVLQTVLFLQILAQSGLFVPALAFRTRVYSRIEYVGELAGERLAGLSGFGFEIWRFDRAWKDREGALVAFDEFARTTGSHEAEALLSAIVEAYAEDGGGRAFFATHFRGVARVPGAAYLRMKGLDREAASEALELDAPLELRLAGINRHMRYELVEDSGGADAGSDALAIAELLGLDPAIAARAAGRFGK
jgi:DNA mismatch repair ATPase MutS